MRERLFLFITMFNLLSYDEMKKALLIFCYQVINFPGRKPPFLTHSARILTFLDLLFFWRTNSPPTPPPGGRKYIFLFYLNLISSRNSAIHSSEAAVPAPRANPFRKKCPSKSPPYLAFPSGIFNPLSPGLSL